MLYRHLMIRSLAFVGTVKIEFEISAGARQILLAILHGIRCSSIPAAAAAAAAAATSDPTD